MSYLKQLLTSAFVLTIALTSLAQSNTAEFFKGKWNVTIKGTPNGDSNMIFDLDSGNGGLTGVVRDTSGVEMSKLTRVDTGDNQITIYFTTQGYDVDLLLKKKDDDHAAGSMAGGMFEVVAVRTSYARLHPTTVVTVAPAPTFDTRSNSIGMKFILINPGSMIVGKFQPTVLKTSQTPDSIYQRGLEMAKRDAKPGFSVALKDPFYIGRFEVTQAQWKTVMGQNPSYFQGNKVDDDAGQHPVENVSWNDAQQFVKKLNALEKGKATYRLPSEFEWEYAARAGADDDISWIEIRKMAVIAAMTTSAVGKKQPNSWGLYDMLGNVWEWTQDLYNEKMFADPIPPTIGTQHVLKGASFYGDVKNATYMTHAAGPASKYDVGLRIIMEVK